MELAILLGTLVVLLAIGVPVAFALLGATLVAFALLDLPAIVAIQRMASGMSVFSLMAIPFFIFAGELMHRAGIAERLVRIAEGALGGCGRFHAVRRRVRLSGGQRLRAGLHAHAHDEGEGV